MSGEKYYSCEWITSGIHFNDTVLRFCCYEYLHSKNDNVIIQNFDGKKIDYKHFFDVRKKYQEMAKSKNVHPNCKNCIYLREDNWDEGDYFDHFMFNHWNNCNAKCYYCFTADMPEEKKRQYYDAYPIIKDMAKKGYLKSSHTACVAFGGGEPTILKEFDKLVDLFLNEGYKNIRVNSSGIKYSDTISKGLKSGAVSLVISPDSGTEKTYNIIKRVPCFNKVWDNIKHYAKYQNDDNNNLKIKFIIIPGVNDTIEEIDNWFKLVVNCGVRAVSVSVEQKWYFANYPNFPDYIYDRLRYIQDKANNLNLDMEVYCEAISVLKIGEEKRNK